MKYIYSTSQMSKLSLTLCTFSITGSVAGLSVPNIYVIERKCGQTLARVRVSQT